MIDGLLRFAESRIIVKVADLEVARFLHCLEDLEINVTFLCVFVG